MSSPFTHFCTKVLSFQERDPPPELVMHKLLKIRLCKDVSPILWQWVPWGPKVAAARFCAVFPRCSAVYGAPPKSDCHQSLIVCWLLSSLQPFPWNSLELLLHLCLNIQHDSLYFLAPAPNLHTFCWPHGSRLPLWAKINCKKRDHGRNKHQHYKRHSTPAVW